MAAARVCSQRVASSVVADAPETLDGVRFVAGEPTRVECAGEWAIRLFNAFPTLDGVGVSDCSRSPSTTGDLEWNTADGSIGRRSRARISIMVQGITRNIRDDAKGITG